MGKSRARVPSYYRQSVQNAVNRQINLGRTKMAASLNREAIGQVVSYCFVAAAHDILDFDAGKAAVLTVKMNNAAERYTLDRDKRGARKARIALEDRTTPLMVETSCSRRESWARRPMSGKSLLNAGMLPTWWPGIAWKPCTT